jgi:hypothetical protein
MKNSLAREPHKEGRIVLKTFSERMAVREKGMRICTGRMVMEVLGSSPDTR